MEFRACAERETYRVLKGEEINNTCAHVHLCLEGVIIGAVERRTVGGI
jgi:hypothetical protein